MSYCRFSSDDFQCDVYCYQSDKGWEIHVARYRFECVTPLPPSVPMSDVDAWLKRYKKVAKMFDEAKLKKIGLACDGESFCDIDPQSAADRLKELRAMGYKVPQYAIDDLTDEAVFDGMPDFTNPS